MRKNYGAVIGSLVMMLAGCGMRSGTLQMSIYGEEYIEQGIPAEEFSDGWAVTFKRFLISVGEVSAAQGEEAPALKETGYRVFDLAKGSAGMGHAVTSALVPGGAYDRVGYRVAPALGALLAGGNAAAADRDLLVQGGLGLYVDGEARKGNVVKTFRWGFPDKVRYGACQSVAQVDGATARSQITIHADHLFYDDLVAEEPNVTFDLVAAADKDNNGEVTQAELAATDIRALANYQVGSNGQVRDLDAFIRFQVGTVGHIDGEGHCAQATRE